MTTLTTTTATPANPGSRRPGATPAHLAEADAAPGAAAARARADAAARAARQALAAVLADRAKVLDSTDAEVARLVDAAIARILTLLAGAPSDYQLWVLPRLMDGIRRVADELAAQVATRSAGALRGVWELGERAVAAPLQAEAAALAAGQAAAATLVATPGAPGAAAAAAAATAAPLAGLGQPSLRQLRAVQTFTTELITGATADAVKTVNRTLGQVVLGVSSPFEAMQAVAAALPEKAKHEVRSIVASQLSTAFNSSAFAELQRRAALDPAIKKQWRRSGKIHSRANHDAADGQVQAVADLFVLMSGAKKTAGQTVHLMFPGDPAAPLGETINCGCVALAWKATWKMKHGAGKPMTDAEKARRDAPRIRPPRPKAAPATTAQQRALAAFGSGGGGGSPLYTDVTRQPLRVDATLLPPTLGDARLVRKGRDLSSYWAVQSIKRPTEVWEQQAVDMGTGEVLRTRSLLKRFEVGGRAWVAQSQFKWDGTAWAPTGPWQAQPAGAGVDLEMSRRRAGVRVWPRRG